MKWSNLKNPLLVLAVAVAALALVAAGCGSDDDESSGGSGSTEVEASNGGEEAASEFTLLSEEEVFKGTGGTPPSSSPPAVDGASVWWVSCGMQIPDCSIPAEAAQEAAGKIGLDFNIADGKLNENGGNLKAANVALAAEPDALIIHGISCPLVAPALQEAKTRGIPVMGVEALDCNEGLEEGEEGTELFTAEMKYSETAESGEEYFEAWGNISASYIVDALKEKAELIVEEANEAGLQKTVNSAFKDTFALCEGCEILDSFTFVSSDLAPGGAAAQQFRTALVQFGKKADGVFMPFDVNITAAEGAAEVERQGLQKQLLTCCGSGGSATIDLVRQGKWDAVAAHSAKWMGWGAIDNINRVLGEEETVPQGIGKVIITKERNLPKNPGEEYSPANDWEAEYEKAWGL